MGEGLDPNTKQWRELFTELMSAEFERQREMLSEIHGLLERQNGRLREAEAAMMAKANAKDVQANALAIAAKADAKAVQANQTAIAKMQTWVMLTAGSTTILAGVVALIQAAK